MAEEKALQCLRAIHLIECAKYKENPESHPSYEKEKSMRNNFLISKGIDVHSKTTNEEWKTFWKKNLDEILQKDWEKKIDLYLADFLSKVDRASPVPSISSSSTSSYENNVKSYRKRSSSTSSRSSCEKRHRKNKKYDSQPSSGSNENETINCEKKLHSRRSFSKEHDKMKKCSINKDIEANLFYSSKRHNKHRVSCEINNDLCKKRNEEIKQQRAEELVNKGIFKYKDLKAAPTKYKEVEDKPLHGANVCIKTCSRSSPLAVKKCSDSLYIDEKFENIPGNFRDFEMQIDDFKPMLRKNIKITLKGDKQLESSQIHSNNEDMASTGNIHASTDKTDNSENMSMKSLRDFYESKIIKKVKNETVYHTVPLSTNVLEEDKANVTSADNYTSEDMLTKYTGAKSVTAAIDKEAVELLKLFHSLSSSFGVLSLPITLLHDKLIEYKKKGSSLMQCFDEDAVALLEMISNKLNNFLKEPDISLVQSAIYKLASRRLASLMTAVDKAKLEETVKPDIFSYGLDLIKIAIACEGKDCSETLRFIKISSLYQNLPELSSDQLMEVYVAIKSVQASSFSQKKLSEHIVPRSYDTHHLNKEINSSLKFPEIHFLKSPTHDTSCGGAANVIILPTLDDPSKSPSSRKKYFFSPKLDTLHDNKSLNSSFKKSNKTNVLNDKINISSSLKKSQYSSYIPVCDKEKSSKIKQHKSSKSQLSDLKKLENHISSDRKALRTEQTNTSRSCSPKQKKIISKTVLDNKHYASSKHPNTSFPPYCQTKSSTIKQHFSSRSSSPEHKKSLKAKHYSSPSPLDQNNSSKLKLQNLLQSSSSQSKSLKMKPQSSSQSLSINHQYSSSNSSFSQMKSGKTKNRSSSRSSSADQKKSSTTKHSSSHSSTSQMKSLKTKHCSTSRSPSVDKKKSSATQRQYLSSHSSSSQIKSLKTKHRSSSRSPSANQNKSSTAKYQYSSSHSSTSQMKSLKTKHSSLSRSPDGQKKSTIKHQYLSPQSSSSQRKSLKTKHLSSSQFFSGDQRKSSAKHFPSSQMKSLKTKHHFLSQTDDVDHKKFSTANHQNSSQSSLLIKTRLLETNHFLTRLSPDKKIPKNSNTSSVTEEKKSSGYSKGGHHFYSPDSPTSPEGQKLSSPIGKKSCSPKMYLSYNRKIDRQRNNYGSSQQKDSKPLFSLSLASVKPVPLSKFNIFEELNYNIDYHAGIDNLKKRSNTSEYVFGKREPVESFLKNCISRTEEKFIRELYKHIQSMDAVEKIKYYIDYNSYSKDVKKLLAVHAEEVALVNPNLGQSMKWRIANLSNQK